MLKLKKRNKNELDGYLENLVDELGSVNAEIASLELRGRAIKAILIGTGLSYIPGISYQASVFEGPRVTFDSEKVKALLTTAQIHRCQRITNVVSVRVSYKKPE